MNLVLLFLLAVAFIFVVIYVVYTQSGSEHLDTSKELRDPMHLSATVYRVTNTILTAANVYTDAMDKLQLPDSINDRYNEWIEKGYVSAVKDQMLCGGCWAFATCSSLADRLTIATAGKWHSLYGLSEQVLISCGGDMGMDFYQGCEGGIPHFAIDALSKVGIPADLSCKTCGGQPPDVSGGGQANRGGGVVNPNNTNTCASGGNTYAATNYTWWQTGCDGNTSCSLTAASTCPCALVTSNMQNLTDFNVKYKTIGEAHTYTSHGPNNELHTVDLWPDIPQDIINANVIRMKKAIYYEGPITIGYRVTQDFYSYWPTATKDNYYKYDGRSPMAGGHAVVIVGWDKMADGTPVWIMKNSWGVNGGYGFPDGPKVTDSDTGKQSPKYLGGFWNHIMGINDSFVESNAVGAHPDLSVSEIAKQLPNNGKDIPSNWNEIMTLRQIYELSSNQQPVTPVMPHSPLPHPASPQPPGYSPVVINSDTFSTITLTPENITPQSISIFFQDRDNYYMVGANNSDMIRHIMTYLPNSESLTVQNLADLVRNLRKNVRGYLVIGARGSANNYYYLSGDPADWQDIFNDTYVGRAATIKKFSSEVFPKFQSLRVQAPIVQLSKKLK